LVFFIDRCHGLPEKAPFRTSHLHTKTLQGFQGLGLIFSDVILFKAARFLRGLQKRLLVIRGEVFECPAVHEQECRGVKVGCEGQVLLKIIDAVRVNNIERVLLTVNSPLLESRESFSPGHWGGIGAEKAKRGQVNLVFHGANDKPAAILGCIHRPAVIG
jgi:hypothetical protein